MTHHMLELIRAIAWHVPLQGPVLEIGAYIEENQDHLNLRQAFPAGTVYTGADVLVGPGVDRAIDLLDEAQVASVAAECQPQVTLCLYVLEHVWEINKAARSLGEIWRLFPESWLFVSTHQNQVYHGTKNYPDYWRITATGMNKLMIDAGVVNSHILISPEASNPTDVVAIRQPLSMLWPEDVINKALKTTTTHWEYPWQVPQ